jgi:glycosyltransferase involved in cell wall biosynthesis
VSENLIQYVNAAQNGDTDAMAKLFSRTLKASFFLAEVLTAGDESAIDITKKAYAKAFCGIDKLKRPEAFEIWMKQNVAAAYRENRKFVFGDADAGAVENSAEFLPETILENEELADIYQSHDVFILPSNYEPWGLVVEEALYWGLPVIVSNKIGCSLDLVYEFGTGEIFQLNEKNSLDKAIEKIENSYNTYKKNVISIDWKERDRKQIAAYTSLIIK